MKPGRRRFIVASILVAAFLLFLLAPAFIVQSPHSILLLDNVGESSSCQFVCPKGTNFNFPIVVAGPHQPGESFRGQYSIEGQASVSQSHQFEQGSLSEANWLRCPEGGSEYVLNSDKHGLYALGLDARQKYSLAISTNGMRKARTSLYLCYLATFGH